MTLTLIALAVGGLFCGVVVGVIAVMALSIRREDAQAPLGPRAPLSSAPSGPLNGTVRGILNLHIRREGEGLREHRVFAGSRTGSEW